MRYISVYYGPVDHAPAPEKIAAVQKLVEDMTKAGVMLATGGCAPPSEGFRIRATGGKLSVTDGPFPETKELLGGYCMMQAKSRAEAVEWGKRFMAIMGEGYCETRLLQETPGE
jgi:hypothetical protein